MLHPILVIATSSAGGEESSVGRAKEIADGLGTWGSSDGLAGSLGSIAGSLLRCIWPVEIIRWLLLIRAIWWFGLLNGTEALCVWGGRTAASEGPCECTLN